MYEQLSEVMDDQKSVRREVFEPFKGLWKEPYFLPDVARSTGGSCYTGGPPEPMHGQPKRFFPRHQDWGSCLVGFQTQVRGVKQWTIQSPFTAAQLDAEPYAGLLGDDNVVYQGDIHPGEILVWPVQMFHSTTGDAFSFAFQQHFHSSLARAVYKERNGKSTFHHGERELPITMFHEKMLAHFACNDQLGGWYCDNSACPAEWLNSFDKNDLEGQKVVGGRDGSPPPGSSSGLSSLSGASEGSDAGRGSGRSGGHVDGTRQTMKESFSIPADGTRNRDGLDLESGGDWTVPRQVDEETTEDQEDPRVHAQVRPSTRAPQKARVLRVVKRGDQSGAYAAGGSSNGAGIGHDNRGEAELKQELTSIRERIADFEALAEARRAVETLEGRLRLVT